MSDRTRYNSAQNFVQISILFKFSLRQLHQGLEGVDTLLVHVLNLLLVDHVDHVDHDNFKLICYQHKTNEK